MKSDAVKMDGSGSIFERVNSTPVMAGMLLLILLTCESATAQLYKYRGPDGEWIYTDRAPGDDAATEIRDLQKGEAAPTVDVRSEMQDGLFTFIARNDFHLPVEVILGLNSLDNLQKPPPLQKLRWVVPPRSSLTLMRLPLIDERTQASADIRYLFIRGDPNSQHRPSQPYRAPFATASGYSVTQAFPHSITHVTPDSYYAVDISMPIGTGIFAARGGTVYEVASTNFDGGTNSDKHLAAANLVRILHDDGTYAVYAHLNWNSIRVRPGDKVVRGQYIADSGNTGFSSGPHLHFAVMRNKGMGIESLPVEFEGGRGSSIAPSTGQVLTAY